MIKQTDYLYHGLNYCDTFGTLSKMLSSGYILTRKSLYDYLSYNEFKDFINNHRLNWNGLDSVSISCHPNDTESINQYNLN